MNDSYNIYADEGVPNIEPTAPPLYNTYSQPQPQHITNNINPAPVYIINNSIPRSTEIIYQNIPVRCICTHCYSCQITVVKEKYSIFQHLLALFCCCCISPCCWCIPSQKTYIHKCRNCHKYLGLYK